MTNHHHHDDAADDVTYSNEVKAFREEKDHYFSTSRQSPIPAEERRGGFGLNYYPPDPAFRVVAEVAPFEQPEIVQLATSTGDIRPQLRYAELRFRIGDQALHLVGFTDPDDAAAPEELFVPFRDATSGHDTYGAGRYLEIAVKRDHTGTATAIIDFNLAYNPYCAYSPYYNCPIPPAENTLPAAITAGERTYSDH